MPTIRVTYVIPADREDEVVAALWARGTTGVQVVDGGGDGTVRLEAWFEGEAPPLEIEAPVAGVEPSGAEEVPDADWMAPYRALAKPFRVGERLLLDPRDPDDSGTEPPGVSESGRTTLRIPARAAFGTGSHESTRLALELLEEVDLARDGGARVLDVGTGTGVLAFAALLFGARSVVAFDVDPAAPCHARTNGELNREPLSDRRPHLFAGTVAALSDAARRSDLEFDLALVNVIPEEIAGDLPRILGLLAPGGRALFSGILAEHGPRVLADLAALSAGGLRPVAERAAAEWVAYLTEKPGR
jgi:ribosomal protein L11 methyltransferase